ncbi:unnamed protein product [Enterobius vermicularis]|uniref:Homeobox domain-containing protein n=1 Tax=Enterobius vermicularis TaxID=51028 RepID=A0A0N4VLA8_ENTVE|nr:unnamed protein product [Enterobius vermicularis]
MFEVPKLERWFRAEPNPSRQKLIQYMNLLNQSNFRKNSTKITYQQICNWFSNQRAAHRSSNRNCDSVIPTATSVSQPVVLNSMQTNLQNDFRPKFDFNTLLENKQNGVANEEFQRIDGGSDSPTPNDDASVHSVSDNGFDQDSTLKQESTTSSPELSLDLNGSLASTSPKPRPSPAATNGLSGQATQAQTPSSTVARSRLMFDPLTELPILEKWFEENQHPTWIQIDQYTERLNSFPYRQSYPPISTHNVKIWFKNRRAKNKRMQSTNAAGDLMA